jgi:ribonuclease Z
MGDVRVSAIRSTHIAGHVSYRVDTPAGSVVIGGDAGNDTPAPPRSSSTSDQVEKLAKGADIIVHSAIHPVMGPDKGSGMFPYAYLRQSSVPDLGAMAKRAGAKHLMLTHLIPPIGADRQYPFKVPGGPLTEADYRKAAQDGGFTGISSSGPISRVCVCLQSKSAFGAAKPLSGRSLCWLIRVVSPMSELRPLMPTRRE